MPMAIKAKIDKFGRIVIPKEIRERRRLEDEVKIIETEKGVQILPVDDIKNVLDRLYSEKLKVDWKKATALSLAGENKDEYWL
ncbi:MAG: AbrB/MazE/SpoVT family DNA-binding domain-containing protein [Candidatus Hydrothermarchaeales archaeon]